MSKLRGIITLALLSCFVVATWGCDFQKQTLPKPKVVSKKIVAPKAPTAVARNSAQSATPAATIAKPGKSVRTSPPVVKRISTAELRPKSDIAATPASGKASHVVAKNIAAPVTGPIAISQPKAQKPSKAPGTKANNTLVGQPIENPEDSGLPPEAARPRPAPSATVVVEVKPATEAVPSSAAVIQPATAPLPPETDTGISAGPAATVAAVTPTVSKSATTADKQKEGVPAHYNPQGRINPFEPLFRDEPEALPLTAKKKRRVPRTPLERIDLGQLKLVGIIVASSGNRALVQEASGKGYIIKEGTYIGLHSGKVTEIKKDRVVIEEETDEVVGTQKMRNKELVLPKPPGE